MTAFIIASAALIVLAVCLALRPLWRGRPLFGLGLLAMLALATGGTYLLIGTPDALGPTQQREAPTTIEEAISRLEAELERNPNQIEGWRLLGRTYAAENRPAEARDALARAVKLAPDDPDLLAEAAEARALAAEDRQFDAEAVAMLRHALDQQPMHQRARWFLGVAQRQAQQPAEAARTWEPLLAVVDPATVAPLREQIDDARSAAGLVPLPAAAPSEAAPATAGIEVSVALDPALAERLPDNATLFVIARQPGGPPMPVAVEKLAASALPLKLRLDDGDSLMPTLKLSQLERVEITARITSGDATARAGDLEATAVVVDLAPAATAALVIDRVVR